MLMKRIWMISAAALLVGSVVCVHAQSQVPPKQDQAPAFYGRGRGGVPFAWNDLNNDGICDLTGQPVGQRPIGFGGGRGWWATAGLATGQVPTLYGRGRGWWATASQATGQVTGQVPTLYGRGRGGLPYAWNDLNRDGVCELTGQPVGQRPVRFGRGWGRGGGRRWR